jgi:rare lipoprotein A
MNRALSILMAAISSVAGMGAAPVPDHPGSQAKTKSKASQPVSKPYQVGDASWYGKSFHGRATASGEDFDMFDLTAAHRQLPLGTLVKVTDLRSGKSVVVRINDRGPYVKNRIMDLSYSAARLLGFRAGVEKVRLDLVKPAPLALESAR